MNVQHTMQVLALRMEAAGYRGITLRLDADGCAWILEATSPIKHLPVLICGWLRSDGTLQDVLSFVFVSPQTPLHLNRWSPNGSNTVDALWQRFWEQEQSNTVKWMVEHLPPVQLDPPPSEQPHNVFDLFVE